MASSDCTSIASAPSIVFVSLVGVARRSLIASFAVDSVMIGLLVEQGDAGFFRPVSVLGVGDDFRFSSISHSPVCATRMTPALCLKGPFILVTVSMLITHCGDSITPSLSGGASVIR